MNLKPRELTSTEFCIGLGLKILMGLAYGYLFFQFYNGDDTWKIHRASIEETRVLLHNPGQFFLEEYTPIESIQKGNALKEIIVFYLNDLEYALVVKTTALFNLVSGGNYYINTILFNLITFWGHYWLFLLLKGLFPSSRKKIFIAVFAFLPAIFWLSGLRSDGLLFFFFSLFLLNLCKRKKLLPAIIGAAGTLIIRPQFASLLMVAVVPYLLSIRLKRSPLIIFATTYAIAAFIFFAAGLQRMVIEKRNLFLALKGTKFEMPELDPSPASFISAFPSAVNHTFFRPYPWEVEKLLQLFYSLENLFSWLLVAAVIFFRHSGWKERLCHPVILMLLSFSISTYIFTGYIVPFPGAIVRYKIIPELLLICIACTLIKENNNITDSSKKSL